MLQCMDGEGGKGSDLRLEGTQAMTRPSLHLHPSSPSSSHRGQAKGQDTQQVRDYGGPEATGSRGIPPTVSHHCLLFCLILVKSSPLGSNILSHLQYGRTGRRQACFPLSLTIVLKTVPLKVHVHTADGDIAIALTLWVWRGPCSLQWAPMAGPQPIFPPHFHRQLDCRTLKKSWRPVMVAHTFDLSALETKAG